MRKNIIIFAYTLIELLVVVSLISLFSFFAIAAYNNFNRTQNLGLTVKELKAVLRDAQNRALSGEKDTTACGDEKLIGWIVNWRTVDYDILGNCENSLDPTDPIVFSTTTYNLSSADGISFRTPDTILFKPVVGGIIPVTGSEICIYNDYSTSIKILISPGGEMSEKKYANTSCTP